MAPSYHALLAVDAKDFTLNPDKKLPDLHAEIWRAVGLACARSGLGDAWRGAEPTHQGDSLFAVLPYETAIPLIHPFGEMLQEVLAEIAPTLQASGLRLRLRAALHAGLVDNERPDAAGISTASNDVHRLLECEPLKAALADSDPDVTFAAMILSAEMFEVYVQGGHTKLRPSQFKLVQAKVKQYDRDAYLRVPVPSQRPDDDGPAPGTEKDTAGDGDDGGGTGGVSIRGVSVKGKGAQSVIGGQINGGIQQGRP